LKDAIEKLWDEVAREVGAVTGKWRLCSFIII
jgi:hypothetical protein